MKTLSEQQSDHWSTLFEAGLEERPLTVIRELYLCKTDDELRSSADTFERLLESPLHSVIEQLGLMPGYVGYEEAINFSNYLSLDVIYDLRFNVVGDFGEERCRMIADRLSDLWVAFKAVVGSSQLLYAVEQKNREVKMQKDTGKRGGKAGKGTPKSKAREGVKAVFKKGRGERTVKEFLSDWISTNDSHCGIICVHAETGYEFRNDQTDEVWKASLKAVQHLAGEALKKI